MKWGITCIIIILPLGIIYAQNKIKMTRFEKIAVASNKSLKVSTLIDGTNILLEFYVSSSEPQYIYLTKPLSIVLVNKEVIQLEYVKGGHYPRQSGVGQWQNEYYYKLDSVSSAKLKIIAVDSVKFVNGNTMLLFGVKDDKKEVISKQIESLID